MVEEYDYKKHLTQSQNSLIKIYAKPMSKSWELLCSLSFEQSEYFK